MTYAKKCFRGISLILCLTLGLGFLSAFTLPQKSGSVNLAQASTVLSQHTISETSLVTQSYELADNSGYDIEGQSLSRHPLHNGKFATISLSVNGGEIINGGQMQPNDTSSYGFIMNPVYAEDNTTPIIDEENETPVQITLKYNHSKTTNLLGTNGHYWQFSEDSWKSGVNKNNVGVVGTGALLVSKSYTGEEDDYKWQNPLFSNGVGSTISNFHSVDFTKHYQPSKYHYEPLTIYTPLGEDLLKGIYIKVLFVYELKYSTEEPTGFLDFTKTVWHYTNVVEKTTFYVINSSADILFQNIYFSENEPAAMKDGTVSSIMREVGTIANGHASNEGFRISVKGENTVKYSKNEATPTTAKDGDTFLEPGRYDFVVTPKIGNPKHTTIYINEKGIRQNIELYFPNGLLTSNSQRIMSDETVPVYTAGRAWYETQAVKKFHMPLVGKIQRLIGQNIVQIDEEDPRYDTNKDEEQYATEPIYELVAELSSERSYSNWGGENDNGLLTEPGFYVAEFINNPDYYSGNVSGDCYNFVFQFILKDETSTPVINQGLLEGNLNFSSYAARYWGVTFPTQGTGNATFAFNNFVSAQKFAYEYYVSLVTEANGVYTFQGNAYTSQAEILTEITKVAEKKVEHKYFDATDKNSYLTTNTAIKDVQSLVLNHNVIVFPDAFSPYNFNYGLPFLNDKNYHHVDENNKITEGSEPVRFIQSADFESKSVILIHEETKAIFEIRYGEPIQTMLMARNAPTGRYKIIERNKYCICPENARNNTCEHDTVYYANYIKPGEIQTSIEVNWTLSNMIANNELKRTDANTRITANSFIISSAKNELDPYGIVKIVKLGNQGWTQLFQLDEVNNFIIDEEGNYEIHLIDRLGNSVRYFVDIYIAKKIYTLTLNNLGEDISTQNAFGGQIIELDAPTNPNTDFEFIGWEDEQGNTYKETYTFNAPKNIVLKAVWNYKETNIRIYDGAKEWTETTKPDQKLILPETFRKGLKLFGFAYEHEKGITFYIGQITSVPNVANMELYAMWVDQSQTLTDEQLTREDMTFIGWVHQTSILTGIIYAHGTVPEGIVVNPLWLANSDEITDNENGILAGIIKPLGTIIGGAMIIIFLAFALRFLFNKLKKMNFAPRTKIAYKFVGTQSTSITATPTIVSRKRTIKFAMPIKLPKKIGTAVIACSMAVLMAFTAGYQLIFTLKQNHDVKASVSAMSQEYTSSRQLKQTEINAEIAKQQEYITRTTEAYNEPLVSFINENTEDDLLITTHVEDFLYSLIYTDLTSFGYDVFPATAIKNDETVIYGLGFSNYDYGYERTTNEKFYFDAGFVSLLDNEIITESDVKEVIEIKPILDNNEIDDNFGFVLTIEEKYGPVHYIAHEHYIRYSVRDFRIIIEASAIADDPSLWDDWGKDFGYLYNYDLGQPVYDNNLGKELEFEPEAFSITQGIDFNIALESAQTMIYQQNEKYLTVDTMTMLFISPQAIADFMYYGQNESYLGLDADTLYYVEANYSDSLFYYIDGEGKVQLAKLPPDPEPRQRNVFRLILSIAQVALGGILICTGIGAGFGAMMLVNGTVGLISEYFYEELEVIFNGLGSIGNGLKCLMVGLSVFSCGPVGWVVGTVMVVAGTATMLVGVNDIVLGLTGVNIIQELTGMSDKAYMWMNLGLNVASTVLTITASIAKAKGLLCFVAGTGVLTVAANGMIVKKSIENVKIGDRVLSYNETSGMKELRTVTDTHTSLHNELIRLKTNDGQTLSSSLEHPYYVENKSSWVAAKDLRAGDILLTVNGKQAIVEQVQHELLEQPQILYNFSVDGNENYYVAENTNAVIDDFLLTHNACKSDYRQRLIDEGKGYEPGVNPGKDVHVHHQIPKEIAKEFNLHDIIDHNDPRYTEWMHKSQHLAKTVQGYAPTVYNQMWRTDLHNVINSGGKITKETVESIWDVLRKLYPK